jgi:hypothetical protein
MLQLYRAFVITRSMRGDRSVGRREDIAQSCLITVSEWFGRATRYCSGDGAAGLSTVG